MALNAACVWEVRTDGNDGNGGGFKAGASGTDRSQQAAAHATLSASSTVHSTTTQVNVAAGDYTVTAADVGNIVQITGGTATAGFYEITAADTVNNRWTLDRAAGTAGQTVVGKLGGALASPGLAVKSVAAGNTVWVKAGTYTLTTTTAGAGGPLHAVTSNVGVRVRGYDTVRGDRAAVPVIEVGAQTSFSVVRCNWSVGLSANQHVVFERLKVDGKGNAGVIGFDVQISGGYGFQNVSECVAANCATGFLVESALGCRAESCTVGFDLGGYLAQIPVRLTLDCVAVGGTTGFRNGYHGTVANCIAVGCSGDGFDTGTNTSSFGVHFLNCTAIACGSDGFYANSGVAYNLVTFANCVATHCGAYGFNIAAHTIVANCAGYKNTSGHCNQSDFMVRDFVALGSDPWRNAVSGADPRPQDRATGLRTIPVPSTVPGVRFIGATIPEWARSPRTRSVR